MNAFNDQYVNPNAYRYVSLKLLQEAGVEILYQMPVIDALLDGQKTRQRSTNGTKYAIEAKRVVDTSQSASVCTFAGKPFPHSNAYMGTLVRVGGVDIMRLLKYIRENDEDWFLRPMVGKKRIQMRWSSWCAAAIRCSSTAL